MKHIYLSICLFLITISIAVAQTYTTPNTGVNWTLDDIANASPSTITVSGSDYTLLENLVISENDMLVLGSDLTLSIDSDLLVTVFGTFLIDGNSVTITAIDQTAPYNGFRFEEFSQINIQNTTIEYGGGLRVLTEDFTLNNCTITNNVEGGATTGAVISLTRGIPQITNNTISFNELPAIASAANNTVSAYIYNNHIEGNNQLNTNRPQINMGTTMVNDTLKIIQNTIIGNPSLDQVGGIAVANLVGGSIRANINYNTIQNNRYGLTIVGPDSFANLYNNIIEDNNTQNIPLQGGSGVSLNTNSGTMEVIAEGNQIRRNLWGITVIGTASINLGDGVDSQGYNIFSENGNEGELYALYNNTSNTIMAKNNCWIEGQVNTLADAESVIFHQVDDASLGEVAFDPVGTNCENLSTEDVEIESFSFYPNPSNGKINFNNIHSFTEITIYGIQGNLLLNKAISEGENKLTFNLPKGLYFISFTNEAQRVVRKLLVP
ncbi:MAG: T9SS type A sorting domain-containing protein [Flavobacteriaceae bacterium]|nr:T9SS type A sorting domain-containing protein [Flavobacteriaceae bacterium]